MTEERWLGCKWPSLMLEFLRGRAGDRKLRLFGVACCRRVWHLLDADSRAAVERVERWVGGLAGEGPERPSAGGHAGQAVGWLTDPVAGRAAERSAHHAALAVAGGIARTEMVQSTQQGIRFREVPADPPARDAERAAQADLLREIFGNPFQGVRLPDGWRDWNGGLLPKLAWGVHADRAWNRLPVLADALEEAGCEDERILAHCRSEQGHVPGCWAVDLLAGWG